MDIRQITAAIILCATIGGYLFLGVWILVNTIFDWIGGRPRTLDRERREGACRARSRPASLGQPVDAEKYQLRRALDSLRVRSGKLS